ncbi:uncharacterized protein LOC132202480 [Neocloeon triangulifer]|uniref:uncharacterized protein LOC132202480 n=1 Tax=Neocloeon triangulifer TaxID=2078957 RepID=UPI00286F4A07|nr:uncharacterized protein LOC132202480 [Neocloeon triangulifer]XP_059485411.1 uncharacterized protein LOC132202480 [Neocloeon triangulifer]
MSMKKIEKCEESSGGVTPVKSTPLKSHFLTPCRRMGLKRSSGVSPLLLQKMSPAPSPASNRSPCAKRQQLVTVAGSPCADSTPKRNVAPRRRSKGLCVTRVERVVVNPVETPKIEESKSEDKALEDITRSISRKKEQIAHLQKGVHPLQSEIERLQSLTETWRGGCRRALEDLLKIMHRNSEDAAKMLTMSILISNLDIPPDLLKFDPDKDEFY